jgi:hypothetical protein
MGLHSGLNIPMLAPPILPTAAAAAQPPPPEYYATPISNVNPLQVLQQPAFYFYTAATCTIKRKECYKVALRADVSNHYMPSDNRRKQRWRQPRDTSRRPLALPTRKRSTTPG